MLRYLRSWLTARIFKHPRNLDDLNGKLVIAGISFEESAGEASEQFQVYGRVSRVSPTEGVILRKADGSGEFVLPPFPLSAYRRAVAGDYHLQDSGKIVTDPDFTTSWTFAMPESMREEVRQQGVTGGFDDVSGEP